MQLQEILNNLDYEIIDNIKEEKTSNSPDDILKKIDIEDIVYDSRKAKNNTIFVAIKGESVNGHKYITSSYNQGCNIFVISENIQLPENSIGIKVENSRKALSKMSKNFFNNPSKDLKIIGVTGTKGKTTITNYIAQVLNNAGINTGVIGTNGIFYNNQYYPTANTTPESYELHKFFRKMKDDGVTCVAMEASSGGMMMNRVEDVEFDISLFTNLSLDHVGDKEHPTFENYRDCKAHLFNLSKNALINIDDEYGEYMASYAKNADCKTFTFSIKNKSNYQASNIQLTKDLNELGSIFTLNEESLSESIDYQINSPGLFSIYNALGVIGTCKLLGLSHDKIKVAIKNAKVDGRVEVINKLHNIPVILDYAHNQLSMENILDTLLEYKPKNLICVFGSVGGRSQLRRKELAEAVSPRCNIAIITSDNPDFEPPENIIDDIAKHITNPNCEIIKINDRAKAIQKAIDIASENDIVVIAGKGHEKYQLINGVKEFYDEKATIIDAINNRISK